MQGVIDEVDEEVRNRAAKLVEEGAIASAHDELDFEHQLAEITKESDKLMMSIGSGQMANEAVFHLIRHPRLLAIAEQFCGSELIASSVWRLRPKVPGHLHGEVPWHQDAGYTDPYCDRALMLTVWLPLVDANEENGCLWVLPKAHKQGVLRHTTNSQKSYLIIPDDERPADRKPICAQVKKGGVLLLSNMTPHASFTNKTDRVRWSMDLRYQNAALPTNAPITRLEGEDSHENDDAVPLACYPPEADFLVRSRLRPEQVMTDAKQFVALREKHRSPGYTNRWRALGDKQ